MDICVTGEGNDRSDSLPYPDDFVVFARSEEQAKAALQLARQILEGELGLTLHPEKTRVVSVTQGFEFLGFHYHRYIKTGRMLKEVRRKSEQRFRDTVRERTPRLKTQRPVKPKNVSFNRLRKNKRVMELIRHVNRHLRGWHGYFRDIWSWSEPFRKFDYFVRSRVRASIMGRVGAGWWYRIITNDALARLGLLSLDDLQLKYYAKSTDPLTRKGSSSGEPYAGKPHAGECAPRSGLSAEGRTLGFGKGGGR
jgi:hypothetical protein